jgi:hypothetical protein
MQRGESLFDSGRCCEATNTVHHAKRHKPEQMSLLQYVWSWAGRDCFFRVAQRQA